MRTVLTNLFGISIVLLLGPNAVAQSSVNTKEVNNSIGMKLVYIPPGKFTMGSPESEPGRESQETPHEVELTTGFYLSAHEITVGQFKQFVLATKFQTDGERDGKGAYGINDAGKIEEMHAKYTWKGPGFEQTDQHPVVNVSWSDAKAFCKWLSEQEKKTYRLPTEAEWEYACRAGSNTAYVHGDDPEGLATVGNGADAAAREKKLAPVTLAGNDGFPYSAPVGRFKPNPFGLYDMHGNVWEFCEDYYGKYSALPKERNALQTVQLGEIRPVMRGGAWHLTGGDCRCANRYIVGSTGRYATGGFRVVCMP